MIRLSLLQFTLACLALTLPAASSHAAIWHRATDWSGAGANPDGAWSYHAIQVENAGGPVTPWYQGAMSNAVWVPAGTRYVNPSGASADWTHIARMRQDRLESSDNSHPTFLPYWLVPAVKWTNNTGQTIGELTISGTASLVWTNANGTNGYNGATLSAVIMRRSADGLTYTMLQDLTSAKPSANWNVQTLPIAVNLSTLSVAPNESIFVALRGHEGQVDYRGQLIDDLTLTAIPEPATVALGLGGLALAVLRRRVGG